MLKSLPCRILLTLILISACRINGQNNSNNQGIENLKILADIWGKLYLLHPNVVNPELNLDWNKVLIDAIPPVEKCESKDLWKVLNKFLFLPLKDPLCFATSSLVADSIDTSYKFKIKKLTDSSIYVDLRDYDFFVGNSFINSFNESISNINSNSTVILDLRWNKVKEDLWMEEIPKQYLFRFFINDTSSCSSVISRVHYGWNEYNQQNAYRQKWEILNSEPLYSIKNPEPWVKRWHPEVDFKKLTILKNPAVFIVNNSSYQFVHPYLDILKRDYNAKIIWEKSGNFSLREKNMIKFNSDLYVNLNINSPIIANKIGTYSDLETEREIKDEDLLRLVSSISPENASASFKFPAMSFPSLKSISPANFSREDKLFGLFKIWIVIKYFYPHLKYASVDWENILPEWIKKIDQTKTDQEYYILLRKLAATLNDSHVRIINKKFPIVLDEYSIPVKVIHIEGKTLISEIKNDSLNNTSTLGIGDELIEIDGKPINEVENELMETISSSTSQYKFWWLYNNNAIIRRPKGTVVKIKIKHHNKIREFSFISSIKPVAAFSNPKTTVHNGIYENSIGYINLFKLKNAKELDSMLFSFKETKGLILDMRGYSYRFGTSAELISRICNYPVKSGIFSYPIINSYDSLSINYSSQQYIITPNENFTYNKPIVVLINELPQSAPENLLIYIKNAKRATFVGSPTTGTNGNISEIALPGDGRMDFTAMKVTYSDGSRFQNIGITPDVLIYPTLKGISANKDEVFEKGVSVLKALTKNN